MPTPLPGDLPDTFFTERLSVRYDRVLLPVADGAAAVRVADRGIILPTQTVPALPIDRTDAGTITVVVLDIAPHEVLQLTPAELSATQELPISVTEEGEILVIRNGRRRLRVPATGLVDQPFPGPIAGLQVDDGPWFGQSQLVDAPLRGALFTEIESLGPCCIQWRTVYRWGNDQCVTLRARWTAGSDTVCIVEEISEDSAAVVAWYPFAGEASQAWRGGIHHQPMTPVSYNHTREARRGHGRRRLQSLSHISYFHQWHLGWAGFTAGDDRFVGLFTGWGGLWERRGGVRIDLCEEDDRGHSLRFPLQRGLRCYGIVFGAAAEMAMDTADHLCVLGQRKVQFADLAPVKVASWVLTAPTEAPQPRLVQQEDLADFRQRLATDPALVAVCTQYAGKEQPAATRFALACWQQDNEQMRRESAALRDFADKLAGVMADGGYEQLSIFDGRNAKFLAYHYDLLRAGGLLSDADDRRLQWAFCALAYMFADPDFCRYPDFWAHTEPEEKMVEALKDDVGDCPVPPNFAAEFFTTTGVVAELFPRHPLHAAWRRWAGEQMDRFLATYFEPDGTYRESLNYHVHCFNEMLCYFYAAQINGGPDYFDDPRVKGSFAHLACLQTPPLAEFILPQSEPALYDTWRRLVLLFADWQHPRRSLLPANGNSGGEGYEQEHGGELSVGAAIYRERDPHLAGVLANAWRRAGRPLLDPVHPLLTLVTLDPRIPLLAPPATSMHRRSLGVCTQAIHPDGLPLYALFRAGDGTHHMDYDQGHVHLMLGDRVLLGDYGYHCHDQAGQSLICFETWLHNTVVYADDPHLSSGYTGLERAPAPQLVHLGDTFDWVVHRIENTNYRDGTRFWYTVMLPAPVTIHLRHYLCVKPDYLLLWDTFESASAVSRWYLHPTRPLLQEGPGAFRAGRVGEPHLRVLFLQPAVPEVVESKQVGPLWSFAVRNAPGQPYLTLLVPQVTEGHITATLEADGRTLQVTGDDLHDTILLPPAGATNALPQVIRKG